MGFDQENMEKQIKNVEAIKVAEDYLEKLEIQNKDLTEKNTVQKEEITSINQSHQASVSLIKVESEDKNSQSRLFQSGKFAY